MWGCWDCWHIIKQAVAFGVPLTSVKCDTIPAWNFRICMSEHWYSRKCYRKADARLAILIHVHMSSVTICRRVKLLRVTTRSRAMNCCRKTTSSPRPPRLASWVWALWAVAWWPICCAAATRSPCGTERHPRFAALSQISCCSVVCLSTVACCRTCCRIALVHSGSLPCAVHIVRSYTVVVCHVLFFNVHLQ